MSLSGTSWQALPGFDAMPAGFSACMVQGSSQGCL